MDVPLHLRRDVQRRLPARCKGKGWSLVEHTYLRDGGPLRAEPVEARRPRCHPPCPKDGDPSGRIIIRPDPIATLPCPKDGNPVR